MSQQLQIF